MAKRIEKTFCDSGNRTKIQTLWNNGSEKYFERYYTTSTILNIQQRPEIVFHSAVYRDIQDMLRENPIKKVCVLGSGDNLAVFAFHFLGLDVTSVDISENQIANARSIADRYNLDIEFVVSDILDLSAIKNSEFDLVYTSNGVLTWIDDLLRMFREAGRVLKEGGFYMMYDVHPCQRPWKDDQLIISKPYFDVGPQQLDGNDGAKTFHWKTEDIVNSLIEAGFRLQFLHELCSGDTKETGNMWRDEQELELNDWKVNPLAALPAWLEVVSEWST
ncbi:MAG: class I SAM-dependent methyltransferase [Spirochaetales bacterium]|jgi:SAM-dependent methyltransferase|nr:class I SAM-dependent methyltransferase [Spirochaetales bacterium]